METEKEQAVAETSENIWKKRAPKEKNLQQMQDPYLLADITRVE